MSRNTFSRNNDVPSASGIAVIATTPMGDERIIPASRRPDGSVRKERKVRPGYVPQEDVATYKNQKAETFKAPEGYVPGIGVVNKPSSPSRQQQLVYEEDLAKSKTAKKNEKRKMKKILERMSAPIEPEVTQSSSNATSTSSQTSKPTSAPTSSSPDDIEKKIKNLRKKLRQIDDIQKKADSGETLLPEQKEKLEKKGSVEAEIAELEKSLGALSVS
ncbi:hypothetical protein HK102_002247 [Quaeritorhiza haematococci]|nr:hypothetical protein HK102_002247 [Quaeritorhiza haematococci]